MTFDELQYLSVSIYEHLANLDRRSIDKYVMRLSEEITNKELFKVKSTMWELLRDEAYKIVERKLTVAEIIKEINRKTLENDEGAVRWEDQLDRLLCFSTAKERIEARPFVETVRRLSQSERSAIILEILALDDELIGTNQQEAQLDPILDKVDAFWRKQSFMKLSKNPGPFGGWESVEEMASAPHGLRTVSEISLMTEEEEGGSGAAVE